MQNSGVRGEQDEQEVALPSGEAMPLGIGEDPRHLAGRMEEYESTSREREPSYINEAIWGLKQEGLAYLRKVSVQDPSLLGDWLVNRVLGAIHPGWSLAQFDARMEKHYTQTEESIQLKPKAVACLVMTYFKLPRYLLPVCMRLSEKVKHRVMARYRYGGTVRRRMVTGRQAGSVSDSTMKQEDRGGLKQEGLAYLNRVQVDYPALFEKWWLQQVILAIYANRRRYSKVEARMETHYTNNITLSPTMIARMAMSYFRIPEKLLPKYILVSQKVKHRVLARQRYAERRLSCPDERMP